MELPFDPLAVGDSFALWKEPAPGCNAEKPTNWPG